MAKKRIYEVAKELGVTNKDIVDYFASKGVNYVPANNLEEAQVKEVQDHFSKKSAPVADTKEKPKSVVKKDAGANKEEKARVAEKEPEKKPVSNDKKPEEQKKKKNITAVFHVENRNSRNGSKDRGDRGRNKDDRRDRDRRPAGRGPIKPRRGADMARPKALDSYPDETFTKKKPAPEKKEAVNKPDTSRFFS